MEMGKNAKKRYISLGEFQVIENQFFIFGKSKISKFLSHDLRENGRESYNIGNIHSLKMFQFKLTKAFSFLFVL